jgi:dihydropyrimidinase
LYDIVIRGGTVASTSDVYLADVAINGEQIVAIGKELPSGRKEIDAGRKLVLPGGIDSHAHVEQLTATGIMNADTWETATTSAAFGGTTTVIAFAAQHVGMNLTTVVEEYSELAKKGAAVDYSFHLIVADPTEKTIQDDIPKLIDAGHKSIKLFMTYDRLQVPDEQFLDVLSAVREKQGLVCVHAENHGMIKWMTGRLLAQGKKEPRFHGSSHPRFAEADAIQRLIYMSALLDQPVMIFHVSTAEGAAIIRKARGEGVRIFAETCPHYLLLDSSYLDSAGSDASKWICSPPLREKPDQAALWRALSLGDLQTVSSDHAPYAFDPTGKLRAGTNPGFKEVPNGMPGLEWRLPLLFDAMVSRNGLGLKKFVELTATAPAEIYGLSSRKGSIAVGMDADIGIWDPNKEIHLSDKLVHDRSGYTPYAGRVIRGWPTTVLCRGSVIVSDNRFHAKAGSGQFLSRNGLSPAPVSPTEPFATVR